MQQLLFLFFLIFTLHSKTLDFSVHIKQNFDSALFDVAEDYDRTISAVGFSKKFKENNAQNQSYNNVFEYLSSVSGNYGTSMHLIKVNKKAKIIFSRTTGLNNCSEAVSIIKTPNNGYYIGGYTHNGKLIVLKLNSDGTLVFSKKFGTKNNNKMNNLVLLKDGGVLVVGSSVTSRSKSDEIFETGLGKNDIYLTRFSKNGTKLWSKKYGTIHDDKGVDVAEARDGSLIIVGSTSYENYKDVNVIRTTQNGSKMWMRNFINDKNIIPYKIIRLRDGNFVLLLSQYDQSKKEQIRLVKFDVQNNIIMDKNLFNVYPSVLKDIEEFTDGTFVGVGYVKDNENVDGLAMLLDSNFLMTTQEHYGGENYDVFNALTILHNSQVAVVGLNTDENSQESNMWLVKLNKNLKMVQIKEIKSSLYENLCIIYDNEIKSKKMSISENLSLNILDNSLYVAIPFFST